MDQLETTLNLKEVRFPRFPYLIYLRQLFRQFGIRALVKQFRFHYRRPFSRYLFQCYCPVGLGLEVGVGFNSVAPLNRTILTDGFSSHAHRTSLATHFFKADSIAAADGTFDFVVSEHVLEHLGNPLKALREWGRVLKPGGKLFLFLPHRGRTFDRDRPRTPLSHLLEDEAKNTLDTDVTHRPEWKSLVVDRGLAPHYQDVPTEKHSELGLIHHHVWVTEDAVEFLERVGFRPIFTEDVCPDRLDSFVIVSEKI